MNSFNFCFFYKSHLSTRYLTLLFKMSVTLLLFFYNTIDHCFLEMVNLNNGTIKCVPSLFGCSAPPTERGRKCRIGGPRWLGSGGGRGGWWGRRWSGATQRLPETSPCRLRWDRAGSKHGETFIHLVGFPGAPVCPGTAGQVKTMFCFWLNQCVHSSDGIHS